MLKQASGEAPLASNSSFLTLLQTPYLADLQSEPADFSRACRKVPAGHNEFSAGGYAASIILARVAIRMKVQKNKTFYDVATLKVYVNTGYATTYEN